MRDVAKQTLLRLHHRLETLGHSVKVSTELTNLVASPGQISGNASAKFSFGQFVGSCSQIEDRFRQVASERETKDAANQKHDEKNEKSAGAGTEKQHEGSAARKSTHYEGSGGDHSVPLATAPGGLLAPGAEENIREKKAAEGFIGDDANR